MSAHQMTDLHMHIILGVDDGSFLIQGYTIKGKSKGEQVC